MTPGITNCRHEVAGETSAETHQGWIPTHTGPSPTDQQRMPSHHPPHRSVMPGTTKDICMCIN